MDESNPRRGERLSAPLGPPPASGRHPILGLQDGVGLADGNSLEAGDFPALELADGQVDVRLLRRHEVEHGLGGPPHVPGRPAPQDVRNQVVGLDHQPHQLLRLGGGGSVLNQLVKALDVDVGDARDAAPVADAQPRLPLVDRLVAVELQPVRVAQGDHPGLVLLLEAEGRPFGKSR